MGRPPFALALAVLCVLAVAWLVLGTRGEDRGGGDDDVADDAPCAETLAPILATRPHDEAVRALTLEETVDPAWLLEELRAGDVRRTAAYERASRCAHIAFDPELARLLIDWFLRDNRVLNLFGNVLLHRMGGAVTSLLEPYAVASDPVLRRKTLTLLMTLPGEARDWTRKRLLDLVQDGDAELARFAMAIASSGVPYDEALARHLLGRIRPAGEVGYAGPEAALARMGSRGVELLLGLLDAPGDDLVLNVFGGLRFARPEDLRPLLPRLAREIEASADDEDRRVAAIRALDALQGDCEACLPALAGALLDESILVLRAALDVLERMGPRAAPALDPLLALLEQGDERIAGRVATLLGTMAAGAPRVVPALVAALSGDVGDEAALALGGFGARVLPQVLAALDGQDEDARYAAVLALGRIGAPAAPATARLVAFARGEDAELAARALDAAGRIGPGAAAIVPVVVDRMLTGEILEPERAARILAGIGAPALGPLRRALNDGESTRRRRAAETVAAMWGHTTALLEDLEPLLSDADRDTRFAAIEAADAALWLPGRPYAYEEADPALRVRVRAFFQRALRSPHADVTSYARDAVARIDAAVPASH